MACSNKRVSIITSYSTFLILRIKQTWKEVKNNSFLSIKKRWSIIKTMHHAKIILQGGIFMKEKENAKELLSFIKEATSPYHVVEEGIVFLKKEGFEELDLKENWQLETGKGYYIKPYGTSLFAFTVGAHFAEGQNFRIAAAHTDHPGFRVKPNADMKSGAYRKLNTDVYGGPILNTWMDRPLSLAGRVALRSEDPFHPEMRLLDVKKPILIIPNLAIHVNKEVNKGVELNRQTDTLPLFSMLEEDVSEEKFFVSFLAKELGVDSSRILDYDMYI
jgi:aspartyl aminopeptidase